jgi:hypothetical protein
MPREARPDYRNISFPLTPLTNNSIIGLLFIIIGKYAKENRL